MLMLFMALRFVSCTHGIGSEQISPLFADSLSARILCVCVLLFFKVYHFNSAICWRSWRRVLQDVKWRFLISGYGNISQDRAQNEVKV